MRFALIAALSLGLAFEAGAASVTSNTSSVNSNSSTSINNSVTSSTSTSSDGTSNVSTTTNITSSSGGTSTSTCTMINNQQQCEITCERPLVARCIAGTAGKGPSCTCQKPRKKSKPSQNQ